MEYLLEVLTMIAGIAIAFFSPFVLYGIVTITVKAYQKWRDNTR